MISHPNKLFRLIFRKREMYFNFEMDHGCEAFPH